MFRSEPLRLEVSPRDPDLLFDLYDVQRRMGDYRAAVETLSTWQSLPETRSRRQICAAPTPRAARPGFIRWQLDRRLVQAKTSYVSPGELAIYYAEPGDKERTLDLLEESCRWHAIDAMWIQFEPAFDFLHAEPRYRALVRKTGLPPAW